MQYRPTAAELLRDIAALLDDHVIDEVNPTLQHKVRVAANLAKILEREVDLAPANALRESDTIRDLLGVPASEHPPLTELRARLADIVRTSDVPGRSDDEVWEALVRITRDDLAICKPGHDTWTGDDWGDGS
ncbi:MAG: hypothetical protein RL219_1614 [Actinomycetota bacterium]|jgi:hypothetical protein